MSIWLFLKNKTVFDLNKNRRPYQTEAPFKELGRWAIKAAQTEQADSWIRDYRIRRLRCRNQPRLR